MNRNYRNMGYNVEYSKFPGQYICVTFWAYKEDVHKFLTKNDSFNSLHDMYNHAMIFINSDFTDYNILDESKYKLMRDFIIYYEKYHLK